MWIDETQSKVWGNLSVLYRSLHNSSLAFEAISQALKLDERNWQLWYNMAIVAIESKSFVWFLKSCLKLIELG